MKTFSLILVTAILASCSQSSANMAVEKIPVSSLVNSWTNTWNNHDSAGVRDLFMNDALVIDNDLISKNIEDISTEWIGPNINAVNNFKAVKLQEWSAADRAGYTGYYEFDYGVQDSAMTKAKGVFTLNWRKTEKGDWKITTADIHSVASKQE